MNYSDAERISTILEKYKFKPAASIDAADLIVFITCGVRQSAEDRVYGQINNIRKKYPDKIIILTGCLAHRKDVQRRLRNKVDLFTNIKYFSKFIGVMLKKLSFEELQANSEQGKSLALRNCDYLKITPHYTSPHTAYTPIMTGCNNFCSYCVVPYARGREYSRPAKDILKEVRDLIKNGCKEIILLGQNVNSYKSFQNKNEINFPKLLQLIEKIPGNFWLAFLTSHPKDMSDELIETIAKSKNICEYVSLPAQSGDNDILRQMNRHYTVSHYKNLIKKIKLSFEEPRPSRKAGGKSLALDKLPPAISTDIIVGFPGETKKQFENTAKLLRKIKFDMAYINQYSPRPETAAWKLKDNVSKKEKVRRDKFLTEILKKTALENNKKYVGKVVEVLVDRILSFPRKRESRNFKLDSRFRGNDNLIKYLAHTRTQKKVIFSSNKKIPVGSFAKVKITKAKAFGLGGEQFRPPLKKGWPIKFPPWCSQD